MATLQTRISDLATAVATKFNAIKAALAPAGGATGQVLTKVSGTDYDTHWADPAAGGVTVTWAAFQALVAASGLTSGVSYFISDICESAIATGTNTYKFDGPTKGLTLVLARGAFTL